MPIKPTSRVGNLLQHVAGFSELAIGPAMVSRRVPNRKLVYLATGWSLSWRQFFRNRKTVPQIEVIFVFEKRLAEAGANSRRNLFALSYSKADEGPSSADASKNKHQFFFAELLVVALKKALFVDGRAPVFGLTDA